MEVQLYFFKDALTAIVLVCNNTFQIQHRIVLKINFKEEKGQQKKPEMNKNIYFIRIRNNLLSKI